jgi:hypothetical protein
LPRQRERCTFPAPADIDGHVGLTFAAIDHRALDMYRRSVAVRLSALDHFRQIRSPGAQDVFEVRDSWIPRTGLPLAY